MKTMNLMLGMLLLVVNNALIWLAANDGMFETRRL